MQTGAVEAVVAGDTSGNVFSSYPLADDGNYKFWVGMRVVEPCD